VKVGLIDGDIYIFAAAAANEYECQWNTWLWTLHADLDNAIASLEGVLAKLVDDLKLDRLVMALSDGANFRKAVMPTYKHNRVGKRKPIVYQAMREWVQEVYEVHMYPALEADDVLGMKATDPDMLGEKIIVSIDKDMLTIPCTSYNSNSGKTVVVTEEDADRAHLLQTLTGDATDGYPGCPGLGPVRALKLLDKEGWTWDTVLAAYDKAGLGEEVALQNARVARILRWDDYDFENKEVKLWTPSAN